MNELILHHYPESPYAEKIRLALGLKGLPWRSVIIPIILPKPDLLPLTGGYRRTPVLQIGADIYCDTERIGAELERRYPEPTLFPGRSEGLAAILASWVGAELFLAAVGHAMARAPERFPIEFHQDRAAMRGIQEVDVKRMVASGPRQLERLRSLLVWIEGLFADGRPYVGGAQAGLADCSLYHSLWFVAEHGPQAAAALEPCPLTRAWMVRVAATGHGSPTPLDAKEALRIARDARPAPDCEVDRANGLGLKAGERVAISAESFGTDPVEGVLTALSPTGASLRREDPAVGEVAVHFPRIGYRIRKA